MLSLISIWSDEKIQEQLDSCTRKKHVFEKMAKRLENGHGFVRSYVQVREKIKQLKQVHKKVKCSSFLMK